MKKREFQKQALALIVLGLTVGSLTPATTARAQDGGGETAGEVTPTSPSSSTPSQGSGPNPGQPRLFEPYNPKASGKAPEGWEIRILEGSQVENTTVLEGKKEIKVTVPAYELVPVKTNTGNGQGTVAVIMDPGFNPRLATAQKETIGAVLTLYSEESVELQEKLEKITAGLEKEMEASGALASSTSGSTNAPTTSGAEPKGSTKGEEKKAAGNDKKKPSNSSR